MSNNLANWDPIRDLVQMSEALNRYWTDMGRRAGEGRNAKPVYRLPVDAYSTEDAIVIEASMGGIDPKEVDITLEKDSVTIRGEIKRPEEEGRNYLIRERGYGIVERTLTLNIPVELDKVQANWNNGVLTLTIPKAEAVKPRKIAVNVTG